MIFLDDAYYCLSFTLFLYFFTLPNDDEVIENEFKHNETSMHNLENLSLEDDIEHLKTNKSFF